MAEGIAMHRFAESMLPENERIFYDPYAIHFVNPEILKYAAEHPKEAKKKLEEMEEMLPGLANSIKARVKYFDDFVENCAVSGCTQFVFLGAGYDTRALRIKKLKSDITIFEVDHPETQCYKKEKIIKFSGKLPENVRYVPVDLETQNLGDNLFSYGYFQDKQTLFVLEGLSMYLPPETIKKVFSFVVSNTQSGSSMILDYFPDSVITGTNPDKISKNILSFTRMMGEPLKFGIPDNQEIDFLCQWKFANPRIITSEEYKKIYFNGKCGDRNVCNLLSFVEVTIP